jgi:aryl-alcohol dehydrogenase-like predicted oxidoreductase
MRKRALGKTGLEVGELCLGTWGLSGEGYGTSVGPSEDVTVITRALGMGYDLFETSQAYGQGNMEEKLGQLLAGRDATVVTRWGTDAAASPRRRDFGLESLKRQADASLERLRRSHIPPRIVALLDSPMAATVQKGEALDYLRELKKSGDIVAFGVSAGSTEVGQAALEAGVDVLSVAYNIFNVSTYRALKTEINAQGVGLLVHSVLAYGLLAGRWSPGRQFLSTDHRSRRWPDGSVRTRINELSLLHPLISGNVMGLRSAALLFALHEDLVSSVVLGPRGVAQLDQLMRDANVEPPYYTEAKLTALEGRLSHANVVR